MAEDFREDSGEYYPGGTVIPKVPETPVAGGGSGGISQMMIGITHAELKTLRDTGKLIPGMQYRITDYVATTVQEHTQSANHPFDIIVTADSVNELNEVASAIRHEGDLYFPATTKFEAWQIWYSLDNDTNRFEWADEANGKGVIYRMIDEFDNDVPYDFKGIKMRAYDIGGMYSDDYRYTFGGSEDNSTRLCFIEGWIYVSYLNKIKPYYDPSYVGDNIYPIKLRINLITLGLGCYSNTFGVGCCDITLGDNAYGNTFGSECYDNILGVSCRYIILGDGCSFSTISNFFSEMTVQNSVSGNIIECTADRGEYEYCRNIEIKSGVTYKEINIDDVEQSYHTEIRPENSITITV